MNYELINAKATICAIYEFILGGNISKKRERFCYPMDSEILINLIKEKANDNKFINYINKISKLYQINPKLIKKFESNKTLRQLMLDDFHDLIIDKIIITDDKFILDLGIKIEFYSFHLYQNDANEIKMIDFSKGVIFLNCDVDLDNENLFYLTLKIWKNDSKTHQILKLKFKNIKIFE